MKYVLLILSLAAMWFGSKMAGNAAWGWWKTLTGTGLFVAGLVGLVAGLMWAD